MMIMLLGQTLLASLPVWVSRPKKGSTRHVGRRISGKGFHVASCAAKRLFLLSIRGLYQGMEARLSFLVLPPVSWAERRTILLSFIKMGRGHGQSDRRRSCGRSSSIKCIPEGWGFPPHQRLLASLATSTILSHQTHHDGRRQVVCPSMSPREVFSRLDAAVQAPALSLVMTAAPEMDRYSGGRGGTTSSASTLTDDCRIIVKCLEIERAV